MKLLFISSCKLSVREYRGEIKEGQSRENGNTGHTRQARQKHNTICVGQHYTQASTNNVNKTRALLQTTGDKDETNIVEIVTDIAPFSHLVSYTQFLCVLFLLLLVLYGSFKSSMFNHAVNHIYVLLLLIWDVRSCLHIIFAFWGFRGLGLGLTPHLTIF